MKTWKKNEIVVGVQFKDEAGKIVQFKRYYWGDLNEVIDLAGPSDSKSSGWLTIKGPVKGFYITKY